MIIDLDRFIRTREKDWKELEDLIARAQSGGLSRFSLKEADRFNFLYRSVSSDLNRLQTYSTDPDLVSHLESLVSAAFSQMYQVRHAGAGTSIWKKLFYGFPATFRKHIKLFYFSTAFTLLGVIFGGLAISFDPSSKRVLIGFDHLRQSPEQRVLHEEKKPQDDYEPGGRAVFSTWLMTHNIKVSVFAVGLGFTFGLGTLSVLFYNGVVLGAVSADYMSAGVTPFLAGWLLPHGAFEIPAILIAGQTGFLIALCLLSRTRQSRLDNLRERGPEILTLVAGLGVLLVWAGVVESFFSQTHEPVLPYSVKIGFGLLELIALFYYLFAVGRSRAIPGALGTSSIRSAGRPRKEPESP